MPGIRESLQRARKREIRKIIFDQNWINSLSKIININGCWIPTRWKSGSDRYVTITINNVEYQLHRLTLCIYHNLNYNDKSWQSRHNTNCNKACFNLEHLQSGTCGDNIRDSVRDKTHYNTRKKVCSKCGSEYRIQVTKTGWNRGKIVRKCDTCQVLRNHGL